MNKRELTNFLSFLHQAEKLKQLMRHSCLSNGRRESVAEHSWRLSLMAMILASQIKRKYDQAKLLKMAIIHDLAEVIAGDHWAFKAIKLDQQDKERLGLKELVKDLAKDAQIEIIELWEEYEENKTEEAKLVKALDKVEVLIQHNEAKISSWNQKEFSFNFEHGDDKCLYDDTLWSLKELVKEECFEKIVREFSK